MASEAKSKVDAAVRVAEANAPDKLSGVALYSRFALAGAICCSVTHGALTPVDVVKTRIQLDPATYNNGMIGGFRKVIANEGAGALLTGVGPTFAGYFLQGAFKFGGYEFFKQQSINLLGVENATNYRTGVYLASSAAAEFFADIALCPLEATRIRLVSEPTYANGLIGGFSKMLKNEGVGAFYAGFGPILFKQVPYTMSKFVVYEKVAEAIYRKYPKNTLSDGMQTAVNLGSGLIAGMAAAVVSQPADTMLSKINKTKGLPGESTTSRLVKIAKDLGLKGSFAGLGARLVMVGTLTAGQFAIYGPSAKKVKLSDDDGQHEPANEQTLISAKMSRSFTEFVPGTMSIIWKQLAHLEFPERDAIEFIDLQDDDSQSLSGDKEVMVVLEVEQSGDNESFHRMGGQGNGNLLREFSNEGPSTMPHIQVELPLFLTDQAKYASALSPWSSVGMAHGYREKAYERMKRWMDGVQAFGHAASVDILMNQPWRDYRSLRGITMPLRQYNRQVRVHIVARASRQIPQQEFHVGLTVATVEGCISCGSRFTFWLDLVISVTSVVIFIVLFVQVPECGGKHLIQAREVAVEPVRWCHLFLAGSFDVVQAIRTMTERVTAPKTRDNMSKQLKRPSTRRHPIRVSSLTVVLKYSLYGYTKDPEYLRSMLTALEQAEPSLKDGPYTSTKGVKEFKNFEQELSDEDCGLVTEELKVAFPNMRHLERRVIKAAHNILCSEEDTEEQQGNGDKVKLVQSCHRMTREVKGALVATEIYSRYGISVWTPSKGNNEESSVQMSKGDFRTVLSCVRQCIKSIDDYMDKSITAIAEQHGGITRHGSLKELMTKLGNAVGTFAIQGLLEQVSALYAMLLASKTRELSGFVNTPGQYLDKVLMVTEDERARKYSRCETVAGRE
ncbi:hypothetical protein DL767_005811 [Monosporascus sp. MG133]|nr:hypothetical protein DL767_005811 [Monosporascus sp. MG133]